MCLKYFISRITHSPQLPSMTCFLSYHAKSVSNPLTLCYHETLKMGKMKTLNIADKLSLSES